MFKQLSNAFAFLYILSSQLIVAQVEELRDSGAFDQACQAGMGPWYFASGYTSNHNNAVPYDIIDLKSKKVSLIDRDGVICFCEGESKFSGLITANNVTLYGNGLVETVVVSPSEDNYFNLIFLKDNDLSQFAQYYPLNLNDEALDISNGKENLELSIRNITFTNSLSRSQSENWLQKYSPNANNIKNQIIENANCLKDQLELSSPSYGEDVGEECFEDNEAFVFGFSQSSIQGNRASTSLMLYDVIFREIDNDNLIEFHSDEGKARLENIQLVQNNNMGGGLLIEGIKILELFNVNANRNNNTTFNFFNNQNVTLSNVHIENSKSYSGLHMMGNFNQSLTKIRIRKNQLFGMVVHSIELTRPTLINEGELYINDFEVLNSQIQSIWFANQQLYAENVFFNNNIWQVPFMFMSSDKKPFQFNKLRFEKNRAGIEETYDSPLPSMSSPIFCLAVSGSGSFNDLTFSSNEINFPIMLHSSKITFNRSYFVENSIIGGNEIYKSFILQIGNFEYNDTQFLNNNFQLVGANPRFQSQKIIIIPRYIYYENNENALSILREDQPPYRLLENHKISMKNVRMDHSEDIASIFAINANTLEDWPQTTDNARERNPSVFQLGVESEEYSAYKFNEVNNIECSFMNGVYRCQ